MSTIGNTRPRRYRGLHRGPQWTVATWYSSIVAALLTIYRTARTGS